jgi:branched-chain amino acid transport system substrate-binding protein
LVVEGLKKAGKDLTREGFIEAMEAIKNWDSGGVIPYVSFSKTDHHAQSAGFIVELKGGKFQPITRWIETE